MKKELFTILLAVVCMITNAQWNDNPAENNRITPLGTEIYDFEFGTSNDGTTFITFNRPTGGVTATFIQIVDVNGNMLFSDAGKMISNKPTLSWTMTNQLIFVDDDGNAIIVVCDCRNSTGTGISYALYKVSPTGEMLWGEDGIDLCGGMEYETLARMNVIQTEDGNYVCAWSVYQGEDAYIQMQKISKTGTLLWNNVRIEAPPLMIDYPYLVNAGNNQVIVTFSKKTAGMYSNRTLTARKIASDGANVWANDLSVFTGFFGMTPLWVIVRAIPDQMGGTFVGWYDSRDNPNKSSTYVAHVKANGTLGFNGIEGGVKVGGHTILTSFEPEMYCDEEEGFLYVTWRETENTIQQSKQQLNIQQLKISSGELMWGQNGVIISPYYDYTISFHTIQGGGDGNAAVFFTTNEWHPQYYFEWDINKVTLINSHGEYVWDNEIIELSNPVGFKDNMLSTPLQFNSYWLTIWGDSRDAGDGKARKVYMQRLNLDGTLGDNGTIVCSPPTNLVVDPITYNSAVVSWEGKADDYELSYRIVEGDWISEEVTGAYSFILEDLIPLTDYQVRVRSICETQISVWSGIISFTTPDAPPPPPCETPVNLNVTEISQTSAILSWEEGNEENLSWSLRFQEASNTDWNDVDLLEEKTYFLENLNQNTAYLWTVRANCSEDRTSEWATENNFTTEPDGIVVEKKDLMTVYASGQMLNIINPENRFIEKIQLFSIDGRIVGDYLVNSTNNVLIPTTLTEMIVFVKIIGNNDIETHKVLMK
ncbi:MAG: fibronectin type III domain-containing protein [Bacteroidales bacterium]|jgi:hypothetical protein|nr:fibronectin type III domain-containing protein [Bacteroidales bacterium]